MKTKLFYSPRLYVPDRFGYQEQPPFLPPLGIAMITSFLKKNNFAVEQDDLDIKVYHDNENKNKKKADMSLFDDRKRIANYIKKGNDDALEEQAERILKKTRYRNSDIVGFSITDDHNFSAIGSTVVLSKLIKERTGALVMIGGVRHQRKIFEKKLTELDYIDFVVLENHITTLNLLNSIENRGFHKVKNVAYNKKSLREHHKVRTKDSYKEFKSRKEEDVIPFPDFNGLPLDLYTPPFSELRKKGIKLKKRFLMLPFSFVNGCLEGCAFCPNSDKPFLHLRTPETAANELKTLSKKFSTRYFLFLNTNVNPTYEYSNRLAKELIRIDANIMWSDCANLKHLDKKLLAKMKTSGAIRLVYGIESASPKMLKYTEKGITQEHAERMLRASHDAGIWNELELIAGMPHETDSDVKATAKFIKRNKPYINYFYLAKYMLMNSKISRFPEKYGITNIKDNIRVLENIQPFNRSFDEVNGLGWNEKVRQIEHSFREICSAISDTGNSEEWTNQKGFNSQGESLHTVFYLYDSSDKKQDVVDYFKSI